MVACGQRPASVVYLANAAAKVLDALVEAGLPEHLLDLLGGRERRVHVRDHLGLLHEPVADRAQPSAQAHERSRGGRSSSDNSPAAQRVGVLRVQRVGAQQLAQLLVQLGHLAAGSQSIEQRKSVRRVATPRQASARAESKRRRTRRAGAGPWRRGTLGGSGQADQLRIRREGSGAASGGGRTGRGGEERSGRGRGGPGAGRTRRERMKALEPLA